MKRFYSEVTVAALADGGFGLHLDGKALRTPAKRPLVLPTSALAEAVVEEWRSQAEVIRPADMVLMKLAATAIDRVAERREEVAAEALRYAGSDLLCYRAESPAELVRREAKLWQPLLDWAADRFSAPLSVVSGIVHVAQPPESLANLGRVLEGLDPLTLTAVADLTASCGSLVLALALWDERIDAGTAAAAVLVDEIYQAEQWGEDAEAAAGRDTLVAEIGAAAQFLSLLRLPA